MEQLIEFAGNHALLAGGFVVALLALLWTEFTRKTQKFAELSPLQAVPMINREGAVVVDISAAADFNRGHILGAKNILPSRFGKPDAEIEKLKGKNILVVCKNGTAAPAAAAALVKVGAEKVAVLKGGMLQWVSDNYPISKR